ncbi:hypothetical protein PROSTU_02033 [Providencia stuartii ATCC 25827]|uniref:Uncharacterized protein n=1 Tax=Providencia stuartii ATCC 25827 TaxID=471874 RepID=A0AA86YI57_PROST|nr:hypothetical protein PROSTU_02033 [Providencia stuartii ATCC 25827]
MFCGKKRFDQPSQTRAVGFCFSPDERSAEENSQRAEPHVIYFLPENERH